MASKSKQRTTMAKIMRENKLREKRVDKQARKDANRQAAAEGPADPGLVPSLIGELPGEGSPGSADQAAPSADRADA